jgi:N-acetylmuramoyl-L-alanine amidase
MPRPDSASTSKTSVGSILADTLRHVAVVAIVGMALATVFTAWTPSIRLNNLFAGFAQPATTPVGLTENTAVVIATATVPAGRPLIGIVAGHKGKTGDSGAVCPDGLTEASVNLDIAQRVQAGLDNAGFQVDLLDEYDPRLEGYAALAVVSIHNDSCAYINEQATGFKVAGALETKAGEESARLVACLVDRYPRQTGLAFHRFSVTPDMTNYHSFYEVNPTTPVAIIETGFLNLDRKILTAEPYRAAQGVIDGILCYALNQPVAPTPAVAP